VNEPLHAFARELHDSIAQSLAAVNLLLQSLIEQPDYPSAATRTMLNRVHVTSRTAHAELRRLITQLRLPEHDRDIPQAPPRQPVVSAASQKLVAVDRLRRLGLIAALKEYFLHALSGKTELIFASISYEPQNLALEMELFRIAQEAISNAIRHGQAKVVRISVSIAAEHAQLLVEDDGSGALEHMRGGVGLGSMRARAARLAGELTLGCSAAGGVSVRVRVPRQNLA
jgi:signal transduction histidine kinase